MSKLTNAYTYQKTQNEAWGFYGTMSSELTEEQTDKIWFEASKAIHLETGVSTACVRQFLDSRMGRHFADCVVDNWSLGETLTDSLQMAIETWKGYKVRKELRKAAGCSKNTNYLVASVLAANS